MTGSKLHSGSLARGARFTYGSAALRQPDDSAITTRDALVSRDCDRIAHADRAGVDHIGIDADARIHPAEARVDRVVLVIVRNTSRSAGRSSCASVVITQRGTGLSTAQSEMSGNLRGSRLSLGARPWQYPHQLLPNSRRTGPFIRSISSRWALGQRLRSLARFAPFHCVVDLPGRSRCKIDAKRQPGKVLHHRRRFESRWWSGPFFFRPSRAARGPWRARP